MKITAVVPAAGRGRRLKEKKDKVFILLKKKPVLFYTLKALESSRLIDEIVLVVGPGHLCYAKDVFLRRFRFTKVKKVTSGGRTRAISVKRGLDLVDKDTDLVLIHDGARPFIKKELIDKVIMVAKKSGAAVLGIPVKATIKEARNLEIEKTIDREFLWEIQTPQVFKKDILTKCYRESGKNNFSPTDDAQILERCGYKVKVVSGNSLNIKITTPEDLVLAKAILKTLNPKS